jgi:hypothetical protein
MGIRKILAPLVIAAGLTGAPSGNVGEVRSVYRGGPSTPHTVRTEIDNDIQMLPMFSSEYGLTGRFLPISGGRYVPIQLLAPNGEYVSSPSLLDGNISEKNFTDIVIPETMVPVFRVDEFGMLVPFQLYDGWYKEIPEGTQIIVSPSGRVFGLLMFPVDLAGKEHELVFLYDVLPFDEERIYTTWEFRGGSWNHNSNPTGRELLKRFGDHIAPNNAHNIVVNGVSGADTIGGRDLTTGNELVRQTIQKYGKKPDRPMTKRRP